MTSRKPGRRAQRTPLLVIWSRPLDAISTFNRGEVGAQAHREAILASEPQSSCRSSFFSSHLEA
jgi:hypothetical protein